jgi:AcrR family transcriptional regulator
MSSPRLPSPTVPVDGRAVRQRILRQARTHFFVHGYSTLTMADLATELGMSKKTLYVHFAGKDAIVGALIEDLGAEVRAAAEKILGNPALGFAEKLHGFVTGMVERLSALDPRSVRDLQRYAPALHGKMDDVRRKNIPYIFGRLVGEGQRAGFVRADLPVEFAIEFFLQATQGLLLPATLERLRLAPRDVIAQSIDLFFGGLLTAAGHKHYEKLFPR